ncbi:MAG TPA: leucyl aminopeptidase, partial [Comamonadaceae bacterium]|nr:leucyl aminopeptidase [Comamonadaceae bacterium]
MNFELKTLSLAAACRHKCDLLVVLIAEGFAAEPDELSSLAARALKERDLEAKPGKLLQLYAPAGVAARRVVLAGCG